MATIGSNIEDSIGDTTIESIEEITKQDQVEEKDVSKKGKVISKKVSSYSFFPPTVAGASSYSMPFSSMSPEIQDDIVLSEAVNSWREGLDGSWSE